MKENKKYEFLEHMADVKVRVCGSGLGEIFENSVLAVSEYMSPDKKIESRKLKVIEIRGIDQKSLLYNFLEELLFLIDSEGFVCSRAKVAMRGNNLSAEVSGDDSSNYSLKQIKSPTYAEMKIEKGKEGWTAEFVLDV